MGVVGPPLPFTDVARNGLGKGVESPSLKLVLPNEFRPNWRCGLKMKKGE